MKIVPLLLFVFLLFLISDHHADAGNDAKEVTDAVKAGIDAATTIADVISGVKVLAKFTKIMGAIAPFLAAVGPLTDIMTRPPKTQDPTMANWKAKVLEVDSNFKNMEKLFGEVTKLQKSQFSPIQQNVNTLSCRLHLLIKAPKDAVEDRKSRFIASYKSSYNNAARKIFDAIMTKDACTDNIPNMAMQHTKYDRKKVERVMTGSLGLLVTAVKVNLAYLKLTNKTSVYNMEKSEWEKSMKEVLQKTKSVDKEVADVWEDQKLKDLKDLSAQYKDDDNKAFASRLYNFYSKKYYWRDWAVIVYNPMAKSSTGKQGHKFKICGGDEYLEKNGRNVLTSSVPKEKAKINVGHYVDKLGSVKTESKVLIHYAWSAKEVMDQISKFSSTPDVCMQAVVPDRAAPGSGIAPGRLAYKKKYFYDMFIFG
jgi:hypothetical protein